MFEPQWSSCSQVTDTSDETESDEDDVSQQVGNRLATCSRKKNLYRKSGYFRPRLIFVHARTYENKTNRNFIHSH